MSENWMFALNDENALFKYTPFSTNALKIIINSELWFGKPINQNDPYEGEFKFEHIGDKISDENLDLMQKLIEPEFKINFNEQFRFDTSDISQLLLSFQESEKLRIKKRFGICSFTKTYKEILLWSHYADSHKGLCFVFDKDILDKSFSNEIPIVKGSKVYYDEKVLTVKIHQSNNPLMFIPGYNILQYKLEDFSDEKEYRYIKYFDSSVLNPDQEVKNRYRGVKFAPKALRCIILGESMTLDNINTIQNLIKNSCSYKDVTVLQAGKSENSIISLNSLEEYPIKKDFKY